MKNCGSTCITNASAIACALARVLQQQAVDGYRIKPVADLADDLREPQQPEVAVGAKQPEVRRQARRAVLPCPLPAVYRPMRCFTSSTVELAMGETRSAPCRSTPATYPGSATISW